MKITKQIVTTKEVEACRRCEKREAEWDVSVSMRRMTLEDKDVARCSTLLGFLCTACKDKVLGSFTRKRRPRKDKEGEPV